VNSRQYLADELARILEGEWAGLSCRELRRRTGRRMADVLAALGRDKRFEHSGGGRGSRWRIVMEPPVSTVWETQGNEDRRWLGLDPSGIPTLPENVA
jgi:hypothetical protein